MVLLQITRALTGGSDRAEILYQVNGPITREFRHLIGAGIPDRAVAPKQRFKGGGGF